jgi:hypothetical protein
MKIIIAISTLSLLLTGIAYAATTNVTPMAPIHTVPSISHVQPQAVAVPKPFVDKNGYHLTVRQVGMDGKLTMPDKEELRIINLMLQNPKATKDMKAKFNDEMKVALKNNNGKSIGIYEIGPKVSK